MGLLVKRNSPNNCMAKIPRLANCMDRIDTLVPSAVHSRLSKAEPILARKSSSMPNAVSCSALRRLIVLSILGGSALYCLPARAQLYRDPSVPIDKRVDDLVKQMMLEEKVRQMQNDAPAIPRLGVPAYEYWSEALHGVARAGEATVFPQAIGMAATWDADLFHAEGQTIGVEGRARYNQAQREGNTGRYNGLTFWSPNINIFRDPRWGRGQETLGEDPYLTGALGTEFIRGMQGDDPHYLQVIATPKHYAVHSGPEPLRHGFDVDPSKRDLFETYLPAFREAIVDGKADSIMCSYNAVDGKPACANHFLLGDILRRDWGFRGFVTSDCGAIEDITKGHHFTKSNLEGDALAVKAGTDMTCGNEYVELVESVRAGLISEQEIDVSVKRLFTARMRLGMFDPSASVPFSRIPIGENHSPAHQQLSLRAARESIVLLKNDGILPLPGAVRHVAAIGPGATSLILHWKAITKELPPGRSCLSMVWNLCLAQTSLPTRKGRPTLRRRPSPFLAQLLREGCTLSSSTEQDLREIQSSPVSTVKSTSIGTL
jgi:beta-glucosidase